MIQLPIIVSVAGAVLALGSGVALATAGSPPPEARGGHATPPLVASYDAREPRLPKQAGLMHGRTQIATRTLLAAPSNASVGVVGR